MNTLFQKKEEALKWLAYASLKNWHEPTDVENVLFEKARLERVISDLFVKDKKDIDYNQYVLNFIKEHGREVVYEDTYTYDVSIPDEQYEMNINTLIDKYTRKKAGAKF